MWVHWIPPVSFTVFIFSTLSLVSGWRVALFARISPASLTLGLQIVLAVLFLALAAYLVLRVRTQRIRRFLWLFAGIGGFAALLGSIHIVVEQVHLLQYGLLGWLYYLPLRKKIEDGSVFPMAWLITFAMGIIDEWIQFYLPNRFGVLPDIYLNGVSAGLSLLLVAKVLCPSASHSRVSPANIRTLCFTAIGLLCLLAVFVSTVSEWGYRHKDPRIGEFYSHFTVEELKNKERVDGKKFGILMEELFPHGAHPYIMNQGEVDRYGMELALHLIRRIQFEGANNLWKAYKENLILTRYFFGSIRDTRFEWTEEKARRIERDMEFPADLFYESLVARELVIADIGPVPFWLGLLSLSAALIWAAARQKD